MGKSCKTEMSVLNASQTKTLNSIFSVPTKATVLFNAVLSLLEALGWVVTAPKRGSHYKLVRPGAEGGALVIPRPHGKRKTLPKYFVEQLRAVLERLGFNPDREGF